MTEIAQINHARALLEQADKLLIVAGAGMSVDSGLPDFRGNEGLWKQYPALGRGHIAFSTIASPLAFREHPHLAWGFYEHRRHLYAQTEPHAGYAALREYASALPGEAFVFTSNVDGHFLKSGFRDDEVLEVHGSINHWQCLDDCNGDLWAAPEELMHVDAERCQLLSELPRCRHCNQIARPNILMFGDNDWQERRSRHQERAYEAWLDLPGQMVILEIGAGLAIPTCRYESERHGAPLIRVNVQDAACTRPDDVSLNMTGLDAISRLTL